MNEKAKRTRRVWAAVTKYPQATLDELGAIVGYTKSRVWQILEDLRSAGYIDFAPRTKGARTILLPFAAIEPTNEAAGQGG